MATKRHYIPGDVNNSPYEPAMGHTAIYRHPKHGRATGDISPAIINRVYTEKELLAAANQDIVNLTVFTSRGIQHVTRVKFSADHDSEGTWDWVPELVRRDVQIEDKPLADKKAYEGTAPKENALVTTKQKAPTKVSS